MFYTRVSKRPTTPVGSWVVLWFISMLACCVGDLEDLGLIQGWGPQDFPGTFMSKIPAGFHSDDTLNWLFLVPVSMLAK